MDAKTEQKRAAAAARQARYVERKRQAGYRVGATVLERDLAAAQVPAAQRALERRGGELGPALNGVEVRALKIGQRVLTLLRAGGWRAWLLRWLLR